MTIPAVAPSNEVDWDAARQEWLTALERLLADIRTWSQQQGWQVTEEPLELEEDHLGSYATSMLIVKTPRDQVIVEPMTRLTFGAQGRVDLYGYPGLTRVKLLRRRALVNIDGLGRPIPGASGADPSWVVKPEMGPLWPKPWARETFVELADLLNPDDD